MSIKLGLHLGYASTRFNEPKIWTKIVRNEFDINYVQFTSNLLEPSFPNSILIDEINKIKYYTRQNRIKINHTFTSPRSNFLAHSNSDINKYWSNWFKKFLWISKELGAEGVGSLLGIMSFADLYNNFKKTEKRVLKGWKELSIYGQKFIINGSNS